MMTLLNNKPLRVLCSVAALALALSFTACKSAKNRPDSSGNGSVSESDINSDLADSDSGRALGLETIHYDYDSSTLSDSAKMILEKNASLLKEKSSVKIQIEGHTDERGGIQYNIALGERRAKSARSFLLSKGVASSRVTVISYGKEKPVDPASNEEAWSKNRRANFRVTAQ